MAMISRFDRGDLGSIPSAASLGIAQLVEQRTVNPCVTGSNPVAETLGLSCNGCIPTLDVGGWGSVPCCPFLNKIYPCGVVV
jgi:hypothetical protein